MRRNGIYVLITLVIVLSLIAGGCGYIAKRATEKTIQSATGNQVEVNQNNGSVTVKNSQGTFQAGGTYQWPSAMPSDVPQFSYGKITSVIQDNSSSNQGVEVGFNNVTPDAFDKYKNDLQNAGWTVDNTTQTTDGFLVGATKGKRTVLASFSSDGNNTFSGAVVYSTGQ